MRRALQATVATTRRQDASLGQRKRLSIEVESPSTVQILDDIALFGEPSREQPEPVARSVEAELKQWLARELHDTVSSALTTMLIQMEQLKQSEGVSHQRGDAEVHRALEGFQESTRQALKNLRSLVHELRNEPLQETGFIDAVRGRLARFDQRTGVVCRLITTEGWPAQLGGQAAYNLTRIVEEGLENVCRHSAARSVELSLGGADEIATMTLRDDGIGFAATSAAGCGFGLIGMRERAALIGGDLHVQGTRGRGTTIHATFPLERLL